MIEIIGIKTKQLNINKIAFNTITDMINIFRN